MVFTIPFLFVAYAVSGTEIVESEADEAAALALVDQGFAAYQRDNFQLAAELYDQSMQIKVTHQAAANLCNLYLHGQGVERDYEVALSYCRLAELSNNLNALVMLGEIYLFGLGVPSDRNRAIQYYSLASVNNHAHAQFVLASLLIESNPIEGKYWLNQAASQGHKEAASVLRKLVSESGSTEKDE